MKFKEIWKCPMKTWWIYMKKESDSVTKTIGENLSMFFLTFVIGWTIPSMNSHSTNCGWPAFQHLDPGLCSHGAPWRGMKNNMKPLIAYFIITLLTTKNWSFILTHCRWKEILSSPLWALFLIWDYFRPLDRWTGTLMAKWLINDMTSTKNL